MFLLYLPEAPRRDASDEYSQYMFSWKKKQQQKIIHVDYSFILNCIRHKML